MTAKCDICKKPITGERTQVLCLGVEAHVACLREWIKYKLTIGKSGKTRLEEEFEGLRQLGLVGEK